MFALCRPKHQGIYSKGNTRKFWPKVTHPASETFDRKLRPNDDRIAQRSQWRSYRKPPSRFRMVPSLTPYDLPFPQMGVPYAPRYANGYIIARCVQHANDRSAWRALVCVPMTSDSQSGNAISQAWQSGWQREPQLEVNWNWKEDRSFEIINRQESCAIAKMTPRCAL